MLALLLLLPPPGLAPSAEAMPAAACPQPLARKTPRPHGAAPGSSGLSPPECRLRAGRPREVLPGHGAARHSLPAGMGPGGDPRGWRGSSREQLHLLGGTARSATTRVTFLVTEMTNSPSILRINAVVRALPSVVIHCCRALSGSGKSIQRSNLPNLRGKSLDWNGKLQRNRFENTNRLGCTYLNLLCCALIGDS